MMSFCLAITNVMGKGVRVSNENRGESSQLTEANWELAEAVPSSTPRYVAFVPPVPPCRWQAEIFIGLWG